MRFFKPLEKPKRVGVRTGDIIKRMMKPVNGDGFPAANAETVRV